MSLLGKDPCDNTTAPTYLSCATTSCTVLITVVASIGNFLVILAVCINPNKDMRSPFNYFIANLSFADLIVGLITAPLGTGYHIIEGLGMKNDRFRDSMHITYFISCTASLLSLTALALDRYAAITYPLVYRAKLNPTRALLVAIVVWVFSILLSMLYFVVGYNRYRFIFATTAVATTFVVLTVTNAKIFKYLRLQVKQWDDLHDSSEENLIKKQAIKLEKKITKTLVIVLLFFLACYLPSCICIYIINLCTNCNCVFIHWVRDTQFVLVMANSGVNPFVYAWRLQNFRQSFKSILTCRACVKREEMSLLGKDACDNTTAPTYLSFATTSCAVLITVVASLGNFLVILAVCINPNKDMRSPFNYFIANLSFADLIVGLITAPLGTGYHIIEGLGMKNDRFRDSMHITYFISCTASLLSLTALALDRYIAITYPLVYRAKLNPTRALLVAIVVWVLSILLSMLYFVVGYNPYRFVFATTAVATTFAVLIFTNTKIFKYLRLQVKQWDDLHDSSEENLAKKQAIKSEKKITKTLVIVLVLFLAFYLPSCICIYIINFCTNCNCVFIHWVRDTQFVLVMANSGVNPFVYAWRLQNFRKSFKSILTCHACVQRLRSISVNLQSSAASTDITIEHKNQEELT
ncbi:Beta-1 adrenergic receptor [Acropora cervicornis]|uniref:Beta-1 adrenergic receptor n=1 Tax=Acropora cervicornis TaxID=6130 RepID=A0AAD9V1I1_ACRCE|nr:Beta-1 adrenergic receptor [Acropora cervicornis]